MALQLYNSLTRRTEEFVPRHDKRVGIYVCGPTVYGHAHLGHAKSYVSFDVLVRYLRYLGYSVTYVQNITDVGHLTDDADAGEDKIAKAARKERKHPMALAEYYTRSYFEDMAISGDALLISGLLRMPRRGLVSLARTPKHTIMSTQIGVVRAGVDPQASRQ